MRYRFFSCLVMAAGLFYSSAAITFEVTGNIEFEITGYSNEGQFTGQDYDYNFSIAAEPEFYREWNNGDDIFIFRPFLRGDQRDDERSHGDIRELSWTHVGDSWEIHTGVRKVFWGVTEFVHLVDIINQTDGVESFDGEEKLGQPMISISRVTDWGIIDGFVLLGFRERTFAGEDGRLRGPLIVDTDRARYESNDEEEHIDFALRWSHSFNVFDVGVYWFDGTSREPLLTQEVINGSPRLIPFYEQISQVGIDAQATIDSWLWKLEVLHRDSDRDDFAATQAGFEYTLYGISDSAADLGLLLEYGWDERGRDATSTSQNDIFIGSRLTLNDIQDTELLMGVGYDADFYTRSLIVEASRRLSDNWTIELEALLFKAGNTDDIAAALDEDDRLQLTLERYF